MTFLKTKTLGYCFGVKRAVDCLKAEIESGTDNIYTYGPLIHNDTFNAYCRDHGVRICEDASLLSDNDTVIIRAHGVPRTILEELSDRHVRVIDMTCPKVARIHRIASESDHLIIVGNPEHPEVIGIAGNCRGDSVIIENIAEAKTFLEKVDKSLDYDVVEQTTYSLEKWQEIRELFSGYTNLCIHETICDSTRTRQMEVSELSKKTDLFIIIGSKSSSNTKKLYDIASQNCTAVLAEDASGINLNYNNYNIIGLSTGASSPEQAVEEVILSMNNENGNINLMEEDIDFAQALESSIRMIRNGQRVTGIVSSINGTEVQIDLGVKHSGIIPLDEFEHDDKPVAVGDEVNAIVVKVNDAEGTALLSKKSLDFEKIIDTIQKAYDEKEILTGKVSDVVKGGVVIDMKKMRVFVPASQATISKNADLEELRGQEVNFKIIEFDNSNPKRRKIIGSIRSVLVEEKRKAQAELWESIVPGNVYEGTVKSLTEFGAFIDIGGVDGLCHITNLTWKKVRKAEEAVAVGDKIMVKVKSVDPEKKRISLTAKDLIQNPWDAFLENYTVGEEIEVTVSKVMPYGAFATINDGVDGLIHISQLADHRVNNVSDVVAEGDTVKVKIVEIDTENKKVSLSIRALAEAATEEDSISD